MKKINLKKEFWPANTIDLGKDGFFLATREQAIKYYGGDFKTLKELYETEKDCKKPA